MAGITDWLRQLGLERYADLFAENEIDLEVLPDLAEADLEKLGLPMGARKKLLKAIAGLGAAAPTRAPEAERRQITVMFCDLVGSTALAEALDPEDLRALMEAYQRACGAVIDHYEGHVAQYLGDGLMTYFGWPRAHEDDAERAVRAGLEIVDAVKAVDAPEPLRVRVGIATGPVVVGETGAGDASVPKLAVGETPNVAARLQGLAGADEIVIAPSTHRLIGGAFEVADLGEHALKGIVEPVRAWRVTGLGRAEGRFEAAQGIHLTPLVGRETEITMLMERWAQAKDGEGQVVLLSGEPGIGKSRIVQVLKERIANEAHIRLRYQCSPYHTNSALHPIVEQFERAAGFDRDDTPEAKLAKMEALLGQALDDVSNVAPLFAAMLSIDAGDRYPALAFSPQRQKEETLKALADQVMALSIRSPVLFLFEDAHWIDPTSHEVLDLIVPRAEKTRALIVITYRPEYEPPWTGHGHVTPMTLSRLGRRQGAAMVEKVTGGKALPGEVLDEIVAKTDGVPLFVEELTKTVLEAGLLRDEGERYTRDGAPPPLAIPSTLQGSLMARLDRLAPNKEVAQIGACIGREFSYGLLAAVSPLCGHELQDALQTLVNSGLIFRTGIPPDATYTFKHALVQDAAYESLLRARRRSIHRAIAEALRNTSPQIADSEPELLAAHFTEAGSTEEAIGYWRSAGQRAAEHSANVESVHHFQRALALIPHLPDSATRARTELDVQIALAPPTMATKTYGGPETGKVYQRALELSEELDDTTRLFPALAGVSTYDMCVGRIEPALELARDMLHRAEERQYRSGIIEAHRLTGLALQWLGRYDQALPHLQRVQEMYDPGRDRELALVYGQDHLMSSLTLTAWMLPYMGFPDRALQVREKACAAADETTQMFSRTYARTLTFNVWQFLRRPSELKASTEWVERLSIEHEIPNWLAIATGYKGWAIAMQGDPRKGLNLLDKGLANHRATGLVAWSPVYLVMLAEVHAINGDPERGLGALDEALEHIAGTQENWLKPEAYRLKALLTYKLQSERTDDTEAWLIEALKAAQAQNAKGWELRAATSLARLWQGQGKRREAHDLLAPVYGWFTEGFDTADLKEARVLLDEFAG